MASESNIIQKPLNQKEIMQRLFGEEILNDVDSEEEMNIFKEVFLQTDPSLLDISRIKLEKNMVLSHIVECSNEGINGFNICCILPSKKTVLSQDDTGTELNEYGTKIVKQNDQRDKSGTIVVHQNKERDESGTICTVPVNQNINGPVPVQVPEKVPISRMINPKLKDLCMHLRAHANCLLADSGYELELRNKKEKKNLILLYHLPNNGNIIPNLPKAWVTLGNMLKSSLNGSGLEHNNIPGKQWENIIEFELDLKNTLIYIEYMMRDNCQHLLHRWLLLDPFVSVAYIDRKISALRKGIKIKAKNSKTSVIGENVVMVLKKKVKKSLTPREKSILPLLKNKEIQSAVNLHESAVSENNVQGEINLNENPVTEKYIQSAINLHENPVTIKEVQNVINLHEIQNAINLHENPITQKEIPSEINLHENKNPIIQFDNIHIGSTFTINKVTHIQNTEPQKPVFNLILCPPDVTPNDITRNQTPGFQIPGFEIPGFQASQFIANLSFDGFKVKQSFINCTIYNQIKSRYKNKCTYKPKNIWKFAIDTNENKKRSRVSLFNNQDTLISAVITKKTSKYVKNPKMGFKRSNKTRISKVRTVLKHLLNTGVVSVNSKIQYKKSKMVKDGKLTNKGILCDCCKEIFSLSRFKLHADSNSKLGSNLNLFVGFNKPYVMCMFEGCYREYRERREKVKVRERVRERNDDACGVCADVGELVCCDSCPASFHASCLPSQNVSEESWYCPRCKCDICDDFVNKSMEISSSSGFLECFQCSKKYHAKCRKDKVIFNEDIPPENWFCENECLQVYKFMQSQVGIPNYTSDGFCFSILRCIHIEGNTNKKLNSEDIAMIAENNMKLAVALRLVEECLSPILDARTGLDLITVVLYNWRVDTANIDYKGFYTVVLEKDDKIISLASIRLHGTKVAELPIIATCIENRRKGMCRRLISFIQQMLESLNIKMLLLSTVPKLVKIWTSRFGFVPIEDKDKETLCKFKLICLPGTVLLKKNLHDVQIE